MDAKDKELAALLLNKFINADSDTEKNYYMTVLYKLYCKDIVRYAKSLVHYLTNLDIYDIEQETSLTFIETLFSYSPEKYQSFDKRLYNNILGRVKDMLSSQKLIHVPEQYMPAMKDIENGKKLDEIAKERNLNKYHLIAAWRILNSSFVPWDDIDEADIANPEEDREEDDDIENLLNYYSCILTRDEQKLIHNLIGKNGKLRTIKELAEIMNISEKKTAAIRNSCMNKITKAKM